MIGETLAHYTLTTKLGAGGMGEIYWAEAKKGKFLLGPRSSVYVRIALKLPEHHTVLCRDCALARF